MAQAGGKKSRDKGAAGENEVCKLLRKYFPDVARELKQYQGSLGRDLSGTEPLCVQVKRHKTISTGQIDGAFREAEGSVDSEYRLPIAMYREDYGAWTVATTMDTITDILDLPVEAADAALMLQMEAEEFLNWLAERKVIKDQEK